MKALAILFLLWGIGYVAAMFLTVKGLPAGPSFLLFAGAILFWNLGSRKDRSRKNQ